MTQTTETQPTQEELIIQLQAELEILKKSSREFELKSKERDKENLDLQKENDILRQKEEQRSRPFWQKLNGWRKELFAIETKPEIKPQLRNRKPEIEKKSIWENKKTIAISALAVLGIGLSVATVQNYTSPESQNKRLTTEIVQESFGVDGVTGLSQKIINGNLGEFQTPEIKQQTAENFKNNLDSKLKSYQVLTKAQIIELIPEALNQVLSEQSNIIGINPELHNSKVIKTFSEPKSTTPAAEYWKDKLNGDSKLVPKFIDAKKMLSTKLAKIKQEYSVFRSIKLSNLNPQLLQLLEFDRQNGLNTDFHLAGNTIHINAKPVHKLNPAELKDFSEIAGRGENDKNFKLVANKETYFVKGSVVNPSKVKSFTTKEKVFTVLVSVPTIPYKPKLIKS
jgi:hypothetical protein